MIFAIWQFMFLMVELSIKCNLLDRMGIDNWISFATKSLDDSDKAILFSVPVTKPFYLASLYISLCGRVVNRAFINYYDNLFLSLGSHK